MKTWVTSRFFHGLKLDWCSSEVDISIDTIRYAVVLVMNRIGNRVDMQSFYNGVDMFMDIL